MEHKDIEALAAKFRTALEAFAKEPEAIWKTIYNSFPDGCCNDASMLLAAYLTDSGFPGAMRVHGEYGGRSGKILSHVWLSLDGLIIDITADQFEEFAFPPLLLLESSQFHESFEIEEEIEVADFRVRYINDPRWLGYLGLMYKNTLSYLSSSPKRPLRCPHRRGGVIEFEIGGYELRSSSIDGVSVSAQASHSAGNPISECKSVYSGSIPTSAFPRVGMAEILDKGATSPLGSGPSEGL